MRAVVVTRFGAADVLRMTEVPDPEPGPGDVVIDVEIASVLWVETMIRRTGGPPGFAIELPYIPGNGVGGRVRTVGTNVDESWIGKAVVAHTGGSGGYAEQVALPAETLSVVPNGLPTAAAAALLHDGVTASTILDTTKVTGGDRVLVVGASGGLGIMLLQLAAARGAVVVGTARDQGKLRRLRDLDTGATIVDSDRPQWVLEAREALGGSATVILDNVGGSLGEAAFGLIAPRGRFSAHGMPSGRFAAPDPAEVERLQVALTGIGELRVNATERQQRTDELLALAVPTESTGGTVRNVVGQVFPLADAATAHAAIEARAVFGATQLHAQEIR